MSDTPTKDMRLRNRNGSVMSQGALNAMMAEMDRIQESEQKMRDTVQMANAIAEYLMAERDMLRKALADILKVEDAPLFRDHLTVHGGTTFWIDQKQGLAALDALQATAAKGGG